MSVEHLLDKLRLVATMTSLARRDRWSVERLQRYQAERLKKLRHFVRHRSPFYRKFHRGLDDAPLSELPVLTKDRLTEAFDEIVTVPGITLDRVRRFAESMSVTDLLDGRYHVIATSGTTGRRGYFVFSKAEWRTLAMASVARGIGWSGYDARAAGRGVVMASTIPWHMTARAAAELRRIGLDAGRMNLDAGAPIGSIVEQLNRYQPTVMMVYPSVMQILAAEQIAGRLNIAPSHIHCTSEVLTQDARETIERAFRRVPANLYAASECGCIAASCNETDGLHISEDLLVLENVDEQNHPVPYHVPGAKILVTVLASRTLPLIRYEMTDRLELESAPCACGRAYARIRDIGGRQGDILRLPGRDGGDVEIAPAQITARLRETPVVQWQLVVTADALTIRCVSGSAKIDAPGIAARIASLLHERGARVPDIHVECLERLERGPTGKSRQITTLAR